MDLPRGDWAASVLLEVTLLKERVLVVVLRESTWCMSPWTIVKLLMVNKEKFDM